MDIKTYILATVSDLVSDFVYYDRKEDEELSAETLNKAIADGIITPEEIADTFRELILNQFKK